MQIQTFDSFLPEHRKLYQDVLHLTEPVSEIYPNYPKWFLNTFLPGLKKKERLCVVAQDETQKLIGCVLVKKTETEKKICTFFVHPDFRRRCVGKQLMIHTLTALGEFPLISVSEKKMAELQPFLLKFGFHLSAAKKGVYHSDETEYYFNDKKADAIKNGLIPVLTQRMNQLKCGQK